MAEAVWRVGVESALARKQVDVAITRLEHLISKAPKSSPQTSELWFRLAAVQQAQADALRDPREIEEARAEVASSIKQVLEGDPTYERLEEARAFLP